MRQCEFSAAVSTMMNNFNDDTRAETNAQLENVLAMAEEMGLDAETVNAIESEIRGRQGAVDAARAARAAEQ